MTRTKAIEILKRLEYYDRPFDNSIESSMKTYQMHEAMNMAIKALEQESCEDAVSRQAVLDELRTCFDTHSIYDENNGENYIIYEDAVDMMEKLQHVTPTQNGWIPVSEKLPESDVKVMI